MSSLRVEGFVAGLKEGGLTVNVLNDAPKGEFVLVIEGAKTEEQKEMTLEDAVETAKKAMENGSSASDAAKEAAKLSGFKKGEIYKALMN